MDVYTAPSFSWVAVMGNVEWKQQGQVVCKLENFSTTLENPSDPFGLVPDGHITIQGPGVEVKIRSMPTVVDGHLRGWLHPNENRTFTRKDVKAVFDTGDIPLLSSTLILVTICEESSWYYRNNSLILKPSTRTRGKCERIGCYWNASNFFFQRFNDAVDHYYLSILHHKHIIELTLFDVSYSCKFISFIGFFHLIGTFPSTVKLFTSFA